MTVCYTEFELRIHGLNLRTLPQLEELRAEILRRLQVSPLPYQRELLTSDIELENGESFAGTFEDEAIAAGLDGKDPAR